MLRQFLLARRISEPGCGQCGYPVRGLSGMVCPECGADQRVVGVVEPRPVAVQSLRRLGWLAGWGVIVIMLAWMGNDFFRAFGPGDISNHRDYKLRPKSGLYGPVTVRRIGYGWGVKLREWAPQSPERALIELDSSPPGPSINSIVHVELPSGDADYAVTRRDQGNATWMKVDTSGIPPRLTAPALLAWMRLLEIDTTRPDVQAEAAELVSLVAAPGLDPSRHAPLAYFHAPSITGGAELWPNHGLIMVIWTGVCSRALR